MGRRLRCARGAASRRNSQRDQQARLAVLDPHHQPLRRRTAAVPAQRHDGEQGKRAHRDRQSGAKRMIAGLPLSFAEPFLLLGLLSLPVLWWLLRVMPPRPRRGEFPPTRLLFQLAPKPYPIERVETLPAIERFLKATGDCEIAWLSDGVDTGRGPEFLQGLSKTIGDRALTIFDGGTAAPLALAAAENAAAKMTVKVLRTDGGVAAGIVRAIDPKGSPIGEARYTFAPQAGGTETAFDLPGEMRNDNAPL